MANILAFVSPPNGREVFPPDGRYVPAFNQGGLPVQWDLPPPNGRYVPAFDQGGLTAQWPVCNGHQSGRPPYSSTRVWLYSCKGCTLVRAWTLRIKQVGPKMEAVDLAWMAV
ncbi:hypothetical protein PCANC_22698 [Puccinia coronata f. sp. avenae]|uniref:Uncharacterized protein n=1 Tax=Puccinia coronata f. sp. avenae TaxID=200324 RepID=A0A2N5S7M8_9BASI|nr:hypothetical protein PCANC_22698 [Puccinia coronata f. sp. avenae]